MLRIRVLTAAVFLAIFLAALFFLSFHAWIAFCTVGLCIAAWEWATLGGLGVGGRIAYAVFLAGAFVAPALTQPHGSLRAYAPIWIYEAAAVFWIVLAPLGLRLRPSIGGNLLLLGVGVVVLLPAFSAAVDLRSVHPGLLLALLVTVWISDTAAYFAGRRFGKRKLAPVISPGKTWEGVAGALAAVAFYAMLWAGLTGAAGIPHWPDGTPMTRPWTVVLLLAFAVVGMIGDLFESLIKRQAGVKDSGTLLPGHGGILDRIDAPMAMLPLAVLVFMR
jgi:phosphatidate cytidylyltransferase